MELDRRTALGIGLAGVGSLGRPVLAGPAVREQAFAVLDLKVSGLVRPMATGDLLPRFAWKLAGDGHELRQQAYRICVARSQDDLVAGRELVWDSGKIMSDRTFDIVYGGPPPTARTRFWWRVEVWPEATGSSVTSPSEFWETGLSAVSDWTAGWLACETEVAALDRAAGLHWISASPAHKVGQVGAFRTRIEVDRPTTAELLLSAHALDGIWLNGEPVTPEDEDPVAWTTMATFTLRLRRGPNILAVAVKRVSGLGVSGAVLAAILRLDGPDGRRLTSAEGWKAALEAPKGWQQATFDDNAWPTAPAAARKPVGEPWPTYPAMLLRREFAVARPLRSARLYATALGAYEAFINGERVGDGRMDPQFTDPSRRLLYQTHDVTGLLAAGANAIGLWVGDGWYGSEYSQGARFTFGPAPCRVLAQLELTYEDGTVETIATGDGWSMAASPILSSEIYDGEVYDARAEQPGWAKPGFAGRDWRPARRAEAPVLVPEPELCPPVRATQVLKMRSVRERAPGVHVFDFGQNFAGWARLRVKGPAGTRVKMLFGEVLGAGGGVDQANLRSAAARDVYILKGGGEEVWEPRFTYHGFRYVEVHGLPEAPDQATLEGVVAHTDLHFSGTLRVSDPVIQKFWENSFWSQRSNFFGLPTDCPQRDERLGWMGDAEVFWPAAAFNMDIEAYTGRVMRDVRSAQGKTGGFPDCVPPFTPGMALSSPGWADAGVILPYIAWRQYGDTGIIAENWEAMDRYLGWIQRSNPTLLWEKSRGADYGDWLSVDARTPQEATTPKDLIGTAYWAADAAMMAEMAAATGRPEDARRYRLLFEEIRARFGSAFVKPDGSVGNGSQTSHVLAIRFGLLSDTQRLEAGKRLAADIAARGNTLSTGFLGTPHILDALADAGQERMAMSLLLQRDYPSWGYMVEKGATTMWERWNSDRGDVGMNSYNHYAFGAIGAFLFRRVAGIDALEPGFRRVRIAPILDPRLKSAAADYKSAAGLIRSAWQLDGDKLSLDVTIPPNVSGVVSLPVSRAHLLKDGRPLRGAAKAAKGRPNATVEVGPGTHRFDARLTAV
ncbi:alpha-L-rhamnosidase [Sphingomonas sp. DBB INV C78]|uniref:family 78 glycoside hydrolase catalytic domain n=1 Tax=Sphingomonas sp. DBB INV C78 TaxID=3349434 RepID=UPI0036D2AC97